MLDHVVGARNREREEVEDAVDDGEEEGVEDLNKVGLQGRQKRASVFALARNERDGKAA